MEDWKEEEEEEEEEEEKKEEKEEEEEEEEARAICKRTLAMKFERNRSVGLCATLSDGQTEN